MKLQKKYKAYSEIRTDELFMLKVGENGNLIVQNTKKNEAAVGILDTHFWKQR